MRWIFYLVYKDIVTVYLYNIDTLHYIFLTVHGTSTYVTKGKDPINEMNEAEKKKRRKEVRNHGT